MPRNHAGDAGEAFLLVEAYADVQPEALRQREARPHAEAVVLDVELVIDVPEIAVAGVEADLIIDSVAEGDAGLDAGEPFGDAAEDRATVDRHFAVSNGHPGNNIDMVFHETNGVAHASRHAPRLRIKVIDPG